MKCGSLNLQGQRYSESSKSGKVSVRTASEVFPANQKMRENFEG
jgi:hypothetical protein